MKQQTIKHVSGLWIIPDYVAEMSWGNFLAIQTKIHLYLLIAIKQNFTMGIAVKLTKNK